MLRSEGINDIIMIAGEFNTPFSTMARSFRQKINTETLGLKYTLTSNRLNQHTQHPTQLKNAPSP